MTSIISIRIKTINRITSAINKISHAINKIFHAVNSEIIISRTLNTAKIRYSRNAAIIHKITSSTINKIIISWIINNTQFFETIIFIFISIEAKSLQSSIFLIRKILTVILHHHQKISTFVIQKNNQCSDNHFNLVFRNFISHSNYLSNFINDQSNIHHSSRLHHPSRLDLCLTNILHRSRLDHLSLNHLLHRHYSHQWIS